MRRRESRIRNGEGKKDPCQHEQESERGQGAEVPLVITLKQPERNRIEGQPSGQGGDPKPQHNRPMFFENPDCASDSNQQRSRGLRHFREGESPAPHDRLAYGGSNIDQRQRKLRREYGVGRYGNPSLRHAARARHQIREKENGGVGREGGDRTRARPHIAPCGAFHGGRDDQQCRCERDDIVAGQQKSNCYGDRRYACNSGDDPVVRPRPERKRGERKSGEHSGTRPGRHDLEAPGRFPKQRRHDKHRSGTDHSGLEFCFDG